MLLETASAGKGTTVIPNASITVDAIIFNVFFFKEMAVIYNDNAKNLQLQKKQLELQEQTLRNNRRDIENSINSMGGSSNASNSSIPLSICTIPNDRFAAV